MFSYEKYEEFKSDLKKDQLSRRAFRTDYFDFLENEIINEEKELDIFLENKSRNIEQINNLTERREILKKISMLTFSKENPLENNFSQENFSNNLMEEGKEGGLHFIAGVISAENELKLRRTIFRVSYGLGLTTFWDMEENISVLEENKIHPKKIFTIFIKNSEAGNDYLLTKLLKICDTLGAIRYNIPPRHLINSVVLDLDQEIKRMVTVLDEQKSSIRSLIQNKIGSIALPGKYTLYKLFFKKQKEIYLNISKCKATNSFFDGEIWVMEKKLDEILNALRNQGNNSSNSPTANIISLDLNINSLNPPTFIDSSEFIFWFQEIVDTYGIPRYQEINPTIFNIVTFPFLFGVMFGDIGHGGLLLILALYLCFNSEKIKNDKTNVLRLAVSGRYILLLMGFFAFYMGWIYNEFFSVALPVFGGSCYDRKIPISSTAYYADKSDPNCVYLFGIDPKWQISRTELSFNNSIKMKLSVLIGVSHMLFGIVLKGLNAIHFKNNLGFYFEFIPQIIFMGSLFGYMDVMIIIKWLRNWKDPSQAPSLISQLMNIFLKFGSVVRIFF